MKNMNYTAAMFLLTSKNVKRIKRENNPIYLVMRKNEIWTSGKNYRACNGSFISKMIHNVVDPEIYKPTTADKNANDWICYDE